MIPAKGRKGLRSWVRRRLAGLVLDALFEQGLVRADVDDTPVPALTITTRDAGTILRTPYLLRITLRRISSPSLASETRVQPRWAWRPENILSYQT